MLTEDLQDLVPDFALHLKAKNKADRTVESYVSVADEFVAWLVATDRPTDPEMSHKVIEAYLVHLKERPNRRTGEKLSPANIAKVYRSLQQLFKWLWKVEGIIEHSPFANLTPPHVPEKPVPVVKQPTLTTLLDETSGRTFDGRRDEALIRFFADTGARCSEVAGMDVEDLDFDLMLATVTGKGGKVRSVPFGPKTAESLRRYLRLRNKHPRAKETSKLWIGRKGALTHFGIRQMFYRRCDKAEVERIHPHQLRHTFAHEWLLNEGQETDLMRITGWRSRSMVDRYGSSAASERAQAAHKRMRLGDRY